jgi:hypothetical protein
MRDPDGYLIEVCQYTPIALGWFNNHSQWGKRYRLCLCGDGRRKRMQEADPTLHRGKATTARRRSFASEFLRKLLSGDELLR